MAGVNSNTSYLDPYFNPRLDVQPQPCRDRSAADFNSGGANHNVASPSPLMRIQV